MRSNHLLAPFISLLGMLTLSSAHAQIYKWVDDKGRTHYSETKPETGKTKAADVKVVRPGTVQAPAAQGANQPGNAPAPGAAAPGWQEQERQLRQRQAEEAIARASKPPVQVRSLSNGRSDGSDASRCNLARDILNGVLRHGNGAPLDQNDIDVAKSDVRHFCR